MIIFAVGFFLKFASFCDIQESPMPDESELFTNVYVKGYGVEVIYPLLQIFNLLCTPNALSLRGTLLLYNVKF